MKDIIDYFFKQAMSRQIHQVDSIAPVEGIFDLQLMQDDKIITHIHEKNLIVNSSFNVLVNLIGYGTPGKVIDTIAMGDAGIVNSAFVFPYKSDVTLRNETFRKTGTSNIVISEADKTITFHFDINETEGNGVGAALYNEAGLFSNDGTMFSRKVFNELVKTPDQKIIIRWSLLWKTN